MNSISIVHIKYKYVRIKYFLLVVHTLAVVSSYPLFIVLKLWIKNLVRQYFVVVAVAVHPPPSAAVHEILLHRRPLRRRTLVGKTVHGHWSGRAEVPERVVNHNAADVLGKCMCFLWD